MKRTFISETEFNEWHEQAAIAVGLAIAGRNAKTGAPAPDKQQTTALTTVGPAEVDEDGNIVDPTLVATIWDDRMLQRGIVDKLLINGLLTASEISTLQNNYQEWSPNTPYTLNEIRSYQGTLYYCIEDNNGELAPTDEGWAPVNTY